MDQILLIQKIIEQESKTSTYKFALLRAIIDIIAAQSPHIEIRSDKVAIPVFLITDKWLFYYWDLIANNYAQIHQKRTLVFENQLRAIQKDHGLQNYWDFNKEFHKQHFNTGLRTAFVDLAKKLNDTIIKNPVTYIGTSLGKGYNALFQIESGKNFRTSNINGYHDLLLNSPLILMEKSYFETFKVYGGLLAGTNSIIINWVDFIEKQQLLAYKSETGKVQEKAVVYGKPSPLGVLLQDETIDRDTEQIRAFWYAKILAGQPVYCTWSGQQIKKNDDLAIDHAIPFSVLFNNDYWNLLPTLKTVNGNKSDKILSENQLFSSKARILNAWDHYLGTPELVETFNAHCQISLSKSQKSTTEELLEKFREINLGFIEYRGMESWEWGKGTTDSPSTNPE